MKVCVTIKEYVEHEVLGKCLMMGYTKEGLARVSPTWSQHIFDVRKVTIKN